MSEYSITESFNTALGTHSPRGLQVLWQLTCSVSRHEGEGKALQENFLEEVAAQQLTADRCAGLSQVREGGERNVQGQEHARQRK